MKTNVKIIPIFLLLGACQATDSSDTSISSFSAGSFAIKAQDIEVTVSGSTSFDQANGVMQMGTNGADKFRSVLSFDISSLSDVSVNNVNLSLYFNGTSNTTMISNTGSLRAYWYGNDCSLSASDHNQAGTEMGVILSSNAELAALSNQDGVTIDITSALQSAISSSHTCFGVIIKFDNDTGTSNDRITYYANYASTVLDAYIPRIQGQF